MLCSLDTRSSRFLKPAATSASMQHVQGSYCMLRTWTHCILNKCTAGGGRKQLWGLLTLLGELSWHTRGVCPVLNTVVHIQLQQGWLSIVTSLQPVQQQPVAHGYQLDRNGLAPPCTCDGLPNMSKAEGCTAWRKDPESNQPPEEQSATPPVVSVYASA